MLSEKLFIILDTIAKIIKKNQKPFGGIQIIFAGDFHQLPPIGEDDDEQSINFCFGSIFGRSNISLITIISTIHYTPYYSIANSSGSKFFFFNIFA